MRHAELQRGHRPKNSDCNTSAASQTEDDSGLVTAAPLRMAAPPYLKPYRSLGKPGYPLPAIR
jgi:hypothetical protein